MLRGHWPAVLYAGNTVAAAEGRVISYVTPPAHFITLKVNTGLSADEAIPCFP